MFKNTLCFIFICILFCSITNAQEGIPVEGVVNGQLIFKYKPFTILEGGKEKLLGVFPEDGNCLISGEGNRTPSKSSMLSVRDASNPSELYKRYTISEPFIPIAQVEKNMEFILHYRDISPGRESDYVSTIVNPTKVNVIAYSDNTIKLGVDSELGLLLITDSARKKAKSLLGYPGSVVTLQPGTSIFWKDKELSPEGNKPITFSIGFEKGEPIISTIKGGNLKFRREDFKGNVIKGVLVQINKGIVEQIIPKKNKR